MTGLGKIVQWFKNYAALLELTAVTELKYTEKVYGKWIFNNVRRA